MGYWESRQAQIMYEQMEDAEKVARELADIYAKATRELNYQIGEIFDRFTDKHNLTEDEARRLLGIMRDPADITTLQEALAKDAKNATLLAELESPAYRARIERLENLQTEIDRMMQSIYEKEKTVTSEHYANVFHNSYYRNIYEIQRAAGFQFSFSAVDYNMLNQMLAMEWEGGNYSSRIWNNTEELARELKEQFILGYLTGKHEADMAAEIANKFAVANYKARRLVRTESNFQSAQAQLTAYEEADVEKYRIVATLDLLTSKKCREMDGKIFPRKEAKVGVNINPFHPFCRTTNVAVLDDDVLSTLKRRARDPVTGESKLVPADTNFKKWYEKNVVNNPEAQAVEKSLKNRENDTILYKKYKKVYGGKEIGATLEEFQKMKYTDSEKWEKLKNRKQDTINAMSEKQIKKLNGLLGNKETRLWYKYMDEQIPNLIDTTQSLEEQAKKAHELRNKYRTQARDLMKNQDIRKQLDKEHPNITFEQLMEKKKEKYGLTGDEVYQDIIRSSQTTNKEYDKKAGIDT